MGRSAKLHKRPKKTAAPSASAHVEQANVVAASKKKAAVKGKTAIRKPGSDGPVLGGADYVDIMMGGRRKAREAAQELPQDDAE